MDSTLLATLITLGASFTGFLFWMSYKHNDKYKKIVMGLWSPVFIMCCVLFASGFLGVAVGYFELAAQIENGEESLSIRSIRSIMTFLRMLVWSGMIGVGVSAYFIVIGLLGRELGAEEGPQEKLDDKTS